MREFTTGPGPRGRRPIFQAIAKAARTARWLVVVFGLCAPVHAEIVSGEDFKIHGDFRLRLESDFDSRRADGTGREDRTRARVRARVSLDFRASEHVGFGVRLRSGSDASHQSPHITVLDFDDNDTGDSDFNLDKWFVNARRGRLHGWAGRNSFPFWKQNELFWDDDATVAGLAGSVQGKIGDSGNLAIHGAYLTLPVGMRRFAGELAGGQLVYSWSGGGAGFTVAAGGFDYSAADPTRDGDALLLRNGNGLRDYRIFAGSLQVDVEVGGRPLRLGADYLHNGEGYSATDPDPFTAANRDETDGLVLSAGYGRTENSGDWQVAYTFARIEALAVLASYAQDDWVRWGSATETDSSDLEGHEFRFTYRLSAKANFMVRLYLVEAITSVQDGKRIRFDFNRSF